MLALLIQSACAGSSQELVTAPAARQAISQTVTATGTLAAQDTVLVGSQVSGTIQFLYVDYNSPVHKGQVLARLDPSLFVAALDQAQATLGQFDAQRAAAVSSVSSSLYTSSAAQKSAQSQYHLITAADEDVRKASSAFALSLLTLRRDRALLRNGYVAQNIVDGDVTNVAVTRDALVAAQTAAKTSRLTSTRALTKREARPHRLPEPLPRNALASLRFAPPPPRFGRHRSTSTTQLLSRPLMAPLFSATSPSAKPWPPHYKRRRSSPLRKTSERWSSMSPSASLMSVRFVLASASRSLYSPIPGEPS
jgi:multidrug efflux pump subunit AcrA (membrane-fusion protein)